MGCHKERGITIAGVVEDDNNRKILKMGLAVKNPSDINYDKKIGREIAKLRAITSPYATFKVTDETALMVFKDELQRFDRLIMKKLNRPDALDQRHIYFWLKAKGMIDPFTQQELNF
jgi:hypothetical protein